MVLVFLDYSTSDMQTEKAINVCMTSYNIYFHEIAHFIKLFRICFGIVFSLFGVCFLFSMQMVLVSIRSKVLVCPIHFVDTHFKFAIFDYDFWFNFCLQMVPVLTILHAEQISSTKLFLDWWHKPTTYSLLEFSVFTKYYACTLHPCLFCYGPSLAWLIYIPHSIWCKLAEEYCNGFTMSFPVG